MIEDALFIAGASFLPFLLFLLLAETFFPKRRQRFSIAARWVSNAGLALSNVGLGRITAPLGGAALAALFSYEGIGLLNMTSLPSPLAIMPGVLALDLASYAQHRMMHAVPVLWRMHLVHHSDCDVDVTTNFRHHPLEALFGIGFQVLVLALIGPSPETVLLFHAIYGLCGGFNHANLRVPALADSLLRLAIVTPDMHRIHHSAWQPETDSNFGGLFAFWDRLFGTYRAEPAAGHGGMQPGVGAFETGRDQWPDRVLMQPFHWKKQASAGRRVHEATSGLKQAHVGGG